MTAPRSITLGVKIGYGLLGVGIGASLILLDWRLAVAGFAALWICAALGLPTKESTLAELARREEAIARARRLADVWEFMADPQRQGISTTSAGPIWEQLRHALDGEQK